MIDPFIAIFVFIICLGGLESWFLSIPSGKKKRGFKVWSRLLHREELEYLNKQPIYFVKRYWSRGYIYLFLRSEDGEAIISPALHGRSLVPYIGYVDLSEPSPKIQYRTCLILNLLPLFLAFVNVFFLLGFLILLINFLGATKEVDKFLKYKIQKDKKIKNSLKIK